LKNLKGSIRPLRYKSKRLKTLFEMPHSPLLSPPLSNNKLFRKKKRKESLDFLFITENSSRIEKIQISRGPTYA